MTNNKRSTINKGKSNYFTLGACNPGEASHKNTDGDALRKF